MRYCAPGCADSGLAESIHGFYGACQAAFVWSVYFGHLPGSLRGTYKRNGENGEFAPEKITDLLKRMEAV